MTKFKKKEAKVKLELLSDIGMLLIVDKCIKGRMCHSICWYIEGNNKYMKGCDPDIILLYLMYCNANNSYGWEMSQKLPIDSFKWL